MANENRFMAERKEKIKAWQALGHQGYAKHFDRTHTAKQASEAVAEQTAALREAADILAEGEVRASKPATQNLDALCGRIVALRDMGKLAFLSIRDVSGDFQICLAAQLLGEAYKSWLKALDLGDYVGFSGEFFVTKHGEPTLMARTVTPLSKALRPLPEKWHGLTDKEACYRERNLDLISNAETFERFKARSQVVKAVRQFYENLGFMEVETSMLQAQAGGAMAKTFQTHHNALDHDFHLRIALELPLKIVCSGGFERVFEIGKCFRNEGTDPSHLQEFTMLEWYAAYVSFEQNIEWNEQMLRQIAQTVFGRTNFKVKDKNEVEHEIDFAQPFERYKFADLLQQYADFDMFAASDDEVREKARSVGVESIDGVGRANLLDDIYKKTARPNLIQPCFVLDYPEDLKPLAAPNGDGTASCFQVLIAGWEVINAYGELIDPQVQRALLEKQAGFKADGDDEAMEVDEVFLKAMEQGFPPMAGQGMGIDRIVTLLTGQDNLRDVVLFPTMKPEEPEKSGEIRNKKETMLAAAMVNTDLIAEDWQALNSVGHLCAAFGAREGKPLFHQDEVITKDGHSIKLNTKQAIMIKKASGNAPLRHLLSAARAQNLHVAEFTRAMLETSDDTKVASMTAQQNWDQIDYFGVLVFGKKSVVEALTKDFALLKSLEGGLHSPAEGNLLQSSEGQCHPCEGRDPDHKDSNSNLNSRLHGNDKKKIIKGEMNRDKAWELVRSRCDWALQRHLAHVAASMEALAHHLGQAEHADTWYITGLLHDIDWNDTINNPQEHCGANTMQYLSEHGVSAEICEAIQAHHTIFGVPIDSDLKKALLAADEISGFAVAVAQMRPTKMMGITPKSITKKMKDKAFAAAVDREHMKYCETYFDLPVAEFLTLLIPAWEAMASEWELE